MDKVFIIGDVIDYVCEFQKEFEEIELEIDDLEQKCMGLIGDEVGFVEVVIGENFLGFMSFNFGFGVELFQSGEFGVEFIVRIESSVDKVLVDFIIF